MMTVFVLLCETVIKRVLLRKDFRQVHYSKSGRSTNTNAALCVSAYLW